MVTNATTIKQISIFNRPRTDICLLVPPLWKSGGTIFFSVLYPKLKSGAAHERAQLCEAASGTRLYKTDAPHTWSSEPD